MIIMMMGCDDLGEGSCVPLVIIKARCVDGVDDSKQADLLIWIAECKNLMCQLSVTKQNISSASVASLMIILKITKCLER